MFFQHVSQKVIFCLCLFTMMRNILIFVNISKLFTVNCNFYINKLQSILISLICCCFHSGRITFKAKVIPETIKTCYSIFFSYFFCSSFSVSTDLVSWWYQCSHWWSQAGTVQCCRTVPHKDPNSQSYLFLLPIFQTNFQPKNVVAHTRVLLCILMTLAPKFRWTRQV